MNTKQWWNDKALEVLRKKICPRVISSTTISTRIALRSNPGFLVNIPFKAFKCDYFPEEKRAEKRNAAK